MTPSYPHFDAMKPIAPDMDAIRERYDVLAKAIAGATSDEGLFELVGEWDTLRRELGQWSTCVGVRFSQDTRDEARKAAQDMLDTAEPEFTRLNTEIQRALIESDRRASLEERFGAQAFALWECALASFEPAVQEALVEENKLISNYSKLISGITVDFQGKKHTLSELNAYMEHGDRTLRHSATRARYEGLASKEEEFDAIFDALVKVRHEIATTLGYENFVALGYQRMSRIDYNEEDVQRFREEVLAQIVPLKQRINLLQRERLKVDKLMLWDMSVYSLEGNPTPGGDHHWMMDAAENFFDAFDAEFAELYRLMREKGLLDLDTREGKAPGGYCNVFYETGLPFIFANFRQVTGDISVFTHEMGHAFQCWNSRDVPLVDYIFATIETAEIPSMSLEFLTLPYLSHFLGERAEEFTWIQLVRSLNVLLSCALGDEFQHWVYRNPEVSPSERRAYWDQLCRRYYPDRDAGELDALVAGRKWHAIGHFFFAPFYYIDYALANAVALQFWTLAQTDHESTMRRYKKLCGMGGTRPFKATLEHIGMNSPFESGSMETMKETVASVLK